MGFVLVVFDDVLCSSFLSCCQPFLVLVVVVFEVVVVVRAGGCCWTLDSELALFFVFPLFAVVLSVASDMLVGGVVCFCVCSVLLSRMASNAAI